MNAKIELMGIIIGILGMVIGCLDSQVIPLAFGGSFVLGCSIIATAISSKQNDNKN